MIEQQTKIEVPNWTDKVSLAYSFGKGEYKRLEYVVQFSSDGATGWYAVTHGDGDPETFDDIAAATEAYNR